MSGGGQDVDHAAFDQYTETQGDGLLNQLDILRGRLIPEEKWPANVRSFNKAWSEWKKSNDYLDFTDLIETCVKEGTAAPNKPEVGFFDEVQDFTPLELALVRSWAKHMDWVMLAGDDDQAIFTFKGATPDAFLNPELPEDQVYVLNQSYRVPSKIHEASQRWVKQLSFRQEKEYKPRDEEGRIDTIRATWRAPEAALKDAEKRMAEGKTVMFLTTCSYMLDPVKAVLRKQSIPFWNPYRTNRGDWNPLSRRDDAVTMTERLLALTQIREDIWGADSRMWTWQDVERWTDPLEAKKLFERGAKSQIMSAAREMGVTEADLSKLAQLMRGDALDHAFQGDVNWWYDNLLSRQKKVADFPVKVFNKHGAKALIDDPQVIIGTIHSVKGGQADVVYMFPDISPSGMRQWLGRPAERDGIIRQMYVGITRAKEHLILCAPASRNNVDMVRHMRPGR